jgi:phage FluMu protein Com
MTDLRCPHCDHLLLKYEGVGNISTRCPKCKSFVSLVSELILDERTKEVIRLPEN